MAEIKLTNTATASIDTPLTWVTKIFVDTVSKKLGIKDDAWLVGVIATEAYIASALNSLSVVNAFGDWSDWDITIAASTTTLSKDMYYNSLTIASDGILITNWYRVFVKWTLTNAWLIKHNWANGWNGWDASSWSAWSAWSAGTWAAAWTLKAWANGSAGGVWVNQNSWWWGVLWWNAWAAVSAITVGLGSAGAIWGRWWDISASSWWLGWTVWTVTNTKTPHSYHEWISFFQTSYITDSTLLFYLWSSWWSGWGSWAAQGSNGWWQAWTSGWGGGGGWAWGIIFIVAKTIINSGIIQALWWNGWNGWKWYAQANSPAKWGGGGTWAGWAGWVIILIYLSKTSSWTISVAWWIPWATAWLWYTNWMTPVSAYDWVVWATWTTWVIYNVPIT